MIDRLDAELERRALAQVEAMEACPRCDGDGYLTEEDTDEDGRFNIWRVGCKTCGGTGGVVLEPCIVCGAPIAEGAPAEDAGHDDECLLLQAEEVR